MLESRVDLFSPVHKGLRALLFETAAIVGRTDFGDAPERERAVAAVLRLLEFLGEHAAREDDQIMRLLRLADPSLAEHLDAQHDMLRLLCAAVRERVGRVLRAAGVPPAGAGDVTVATEARELERLVYRLVADQLDHFDAEDTEVAAALWAHYDDEALAAVRRRIVADTPDTRLVQWIEVLAPALRYEERVQALAALGSDLPTERYRSVMRRARAAIRQLPRPAEPGPQAAAKGA